MAQRFRLSKDATSAIHSLVFYSMLAGVVLEAMHMVNVDLTAFTISAVRWRLASALAPGTNQQFHWRLIMLAERPVRLGERIIFAVQMAWWKIVGFRCTKLRTNSDHLMTIPNSTLVNESIETSIGGATIRRKINILGDLQHHTRRAGHCRPGGSQHSGRARDSRTDPPDCRLRGILAGVFLASSPRRAW